MGISGTFEPTLKIQGLIRLAVGLGIMAIALATCDSGGNGPAGDELSFTLSHSDCQSSRAGAATYAANLDCLELTVTEGPVLHLIHRNAAFNCCPGDLEADITVAGNAITIVERELQAACDCDCLYDLTYTISGLAAGSYTVTVVEPYVPATDSVLACQIALFSGLQARCCLERPYYPWATGR